MIDKIIVKPLAAESLGARSMCTYVVTPDVQILLDAGVSLCPYRFGLPPHPLEFENIENLRKSIAKVADQVEVVTISHYHFDHHTPSFEDWVVNWTEKDETARQIYKDKIVIMKNPLENINRSQLERARNFRKTTGKYAKMLHEADGQAFSFGDTKIRFSESVPHGFERSGLGWVVMATIEYGDERFLFAPDVQGPMSERTLDLILKEGPEVVMVGGPPFYLEGSRVDESHIRDGLDNLGRLAEKIPVTIMEHHALRGLNWNQKIEEIKAAALRSEHKIQTAAEYLKEENNFLEVRRKKLFELYPPSREFEEWCRLSSEEMTHTKPPI